MNGLREVEIPGAARATEHSTAMATLCGNCTKAYPHENEEGEKLDIPRKCKRCGAPMQASKVLEFADGQAKIARDPALAGAVIDD